MKITAVVPCKNEEKSLPKTIKRLQNVVDEIIVVDNGSTDSSAAVASYYGAIVISEYRKQNGIGYGYALITGINNAGGDYIVTIDADGEHPIEEIPTIIQYAQINSIDYISCNRTTTESSKLNTKIRKLGIWLLSKEVKLLFGYDMKDVLSGMWVMKKSVVSELGLRQGDWNLSPEIKLSALMSKSISFAEFPIVATVRDNGKSKQILWKTALQHALFIFNYRLDLLLRPLYNASKDALYSIIGR